MASRPPRPIPPSQWRLAVPEGQATGLHARERTDELQQVHAPLEAMGFARLPVLPGRLGRYTTCWAHPAGVVVHAIHPGPDAPRQGVGKIKLYASLDMGLYHARKWTPPGSHAFSRRTDGTVVLDVEIDLDDASQGLLGHLRMLQARGHLRSLQDQVRDRQRGYATWLDRSLPWEPGPEDAPWLACAQALGVPGLVHAIKGAPLPEAATADATDLAQDVITHLRAHARTVGRRYPSPGQRDRLDRWIRAGLEGPGPVDLDFKPAWGGLDQLRVWTWMAQHAGVAPMLGQWLARAPEPALRQAVLPSDHHPGWGPLLATTLASQVRCLPYRGNERAPSFHEHVPAYLSTLARRLGPQWPDVFGATPFNEVFMSVKWGSNSHPAIPASMATLLSACQSLGVALPLPTGDEFRHPSLEAMRRRASYEGLDFAPMDSVLAARQLGQALPDSAPAPTSMPLARARRL